MERRKFTRELKLEAVKLIQERGVTVFYFLCLPPRTPFISRLIGFRCRPTCSETALTSIRTGEQPIQKHYTYFDDNRAFYRPRPMEECVYHSLLELAMV